MIVTGIVQSETFHQPLGYPVYSWCTSHSYDL